MVAFDISVSYSIMTIALIITQCLKESGQAMHKTKKHVPRDAIGYKPSQLLCNFREIQR